MIFNTTETKLNFPIFWAKQNRTEFLLQEDVFSRLDSNQETGSEQKSMEVIVTNVQIRLCKYTF